MQLKDLDKLQKDDLKSVLKQYKKDLIAEKQASIKYSDNVVYNTEVIPPETQKKSLISEETDSLENAPFKVTVVCNTANWCDSYMDVLTTDSYTKSIKQRGNTIPHIADHEHKSTSHVGDVQKVYTKKIRCKDLGFDSDQETTALVMETLIRADYNEDVYKFYKAGKINQHSIGLNYIKIELALNSQVEEDAEEYAIWSKYYPSIINKELVDKKGYFWAVSEIDILENSCVLFGANSLTPTLVTEQKSLPQITTKGVDMKTVEELQQEILLLQAEIANLKAEKSLTSETATKSERERILTILKAAETFKIKGSLEKFIVKGLDAETVRESFELIAENYQKNNPSPNGADESTLNEKTVNDNTADGLQYGGILEGLKHLEKQNLFANIK